MTILPLSLPITALLMARLAAPPLTATTVPVSVVPSTPGVTALFTGVVDRGGVAPNVLGVYAAPQILTVAPMAPLVVPPAQPQAVSEQERGAEQQRQVCSAAVKSGDTARIAALQCR